PQPARVPSEPQQPRRIIGEARVVKHPEQPRVEVRERARGLDQLPGSLAAERGRERVDGEVAASQVLLDTGRLDVRKRARTRVPLATGPRDVVGESAGRHRGGTE